jgi:hypothetical protein
MSLILEALKKLERDKQAPDRGFVVMAPVTWPAAVTPRSVMVGAPLLLVTIAAGVGAYLALARAPERLPVVPVAMPVVAAQPAVADPRPAAVPFAPPRPRPAARPAAAPAPAADEPLELQAISERDGKPVAVLSGRVVGEGDSFDQVRVLRIGPSEVEVEVRGQRRLLKF